MTHSPEAKVTSSVVITANMRPLEQSLVFWVVSQSVLTKHATSPLCYTSRRLLINSEDSLSHYCFSVFHM
ncbi:hypothetical protein J6590_066767, partial [Homalodisca vitripennis]